MLHESFYKIVFLNCFLVALGLFFTQTYVIILPSIAENLFISNSTIQIIFTTSTLFFGLSQLFYGYLAETFGRRTTLLAGLHTALTGSIISGLAANSMTLGIGQIITGMGAGACSVIPRAISKDVCWGPQLIKAIAYMSIVSTTSTAIAPLLGSLLLLHYGWRAVFVFLVIITLFTIILVTKFCKETLNKEQKFEVSLFKDYGRLFTNKSFLFYSIINASAFSAIIFYLVATPFIFQKMLHFSLIQNSTVFLACSISYLLGNVIISNISENVNSKLLILLGIISIASGFLLLIHLSNINLVMCGLLINMGSGILTPITYREILILSKFPAGISSGAINAFRTLVAFIFSLSIAFFSLNICLFTMIFILSCMLLCVFYLYARKMFEGVI